MLRPTLVLCFGMALFLALGPAPSEQCSQRHKCYACGSPFSSCSVSDPGADEVIDCAERFSRKPTPGFQYGCRKAVSSRGEVFKMCDIRPTDEGSKCSTDGGILVCTCSSYGGFCNSSPSLRQTKFGPLSAVGLALFVVYLGFNLVYRI